jgi:uncharacterized DUF497 family protein
MPVGELEWDDENEEHISRHRVDESEVEEAFHSSTFIRHARDGAYRVVGQTRGGRYLTIFVARRNHGVWYVITARDSTLKERRAYLATR